MFSHLETRDRGAQSGRYYVHDMLPHILTRYADWKLCWSSVRGGTDGVLTVAVVLGPSREFTLARVP
jgi:hypothetical protein